MTDKQQIKQLTEALLRYVAVYGKTHLQADGLYTTAELMSKFGIIALPKNAVVLTQEEYNALMLEQKRLKEIVDRIPCGYELKDKTRKETAREILEEFANLEVGDCLVAWDVIAKVSEKLLELEEQFGVEVDNE